MSTPGLSRLEVEELLQNAEGEMREVCLYVPPRILEVLRNLIQVCRIQQKQIADLNEAIDLLQDDGR